MTKSTSLIVQTVYTYGANLSRPSLAGLRLEGLQLQLQYPALCRTVLITTCQTGRIGQPNR